MAVSRLLGGEEIGGPQDFLVVLTGQRPVLVAAGQGEPEIEDLHRAAGVEDEVGRLDVAVHESLLVGVLKAGCGLADEVRGLADGQRPVALDFCVEVDAVDVLHCDVVNGAGRIEVERANDVRMAEPRRLPGLTFEAGEVGSLFDPLHRQHLDGNLAVERGVLSEIHAAHSPCPEQPQQPVFSEGEALVTPLEQLLDLPLREQARFG